MRILVIEDDKEIANFIAKGLLEAGFTVDIAYDGRDGLFLASEEIYDVIVMDRMLPMFDGLTVLKALRSSNIQMPVLMLSAMADVNHRIEGLRAGSDDYMTKPFSISELVVRVQVLLKRVSGLSDETTFHIDDLTVNLLSRQVMRQGKTIDLKQKEFQLLDFLLRNVGQVVTRTMIMEHIWNYNYDPSTNVVDVHISKLRKKIDEGHENKLIHTIRGAGYVLRKN